MNEVVVVKTGTANTASVLAALRRVGCAPVLSAGAAEIERAGAVVLPGVGSFGAAMREIERAGLVDVLAERVVAGRPTLCICLGLQVLAKESEESPGVRGLGVLDSCVTKFGGGVRVPHMGWNEVNWEVERAAGRPDGSEAESKRGMAAVLKPGGAGSAQWAVGSGNQGPHITQHTAHSSGSGLRDGFAYFANSYKLDEVPSGWVGAMSVHGTPFVAAIARGGVLACQFHPELSGEWGLGLIRAWLQRAGVIAC